MRTPLVLLKFLAKSLGNAFGAGVAGDLVVDVLPEVCKDAWEWWSKDRNAAERKADVEAVAQAGTQQVKEEVAEIVLTFAADKPQNVQEIMAVLLTQVPSLIRKSLRRPSDPTGTTLTADREPKNSEDLLSLLPSKPPRFKPGDHPLIGVDWELTELLGVGGFGEVWKARNPHMPSMAPVALKFCLDSMAARVLRNEAAILNQVMQEGKHFGFVELLHTYLNADTPCLEYEFVEGGDLAGVIQAHHRSNDRPNHEQLTKDVLQLAEIVGFAHKLKPPIVHRDLKPANILVNRMPGGTTTFKIADFGIGGVAANQILLESTKGTTQGRFLVSAVRGSFTPLYASPQQTRGDKPDTRDDVHALGVIWYQMLTNNLTNGRPSGDKYKDRLAALGMTKGMMDLLASCFEDEPDDRPDNAAVLAEKIKEQLSVVNNAEPAVPKPTEPTVIEQPPNPLPKPTSQPKLGDIFGKKSRLFDTEPNNYTGGGIWQIRLNAKQTLEVPCQIVQMRKDQRNARIRVRVDDIPLPNGDKQTFIAHFQRPGLTFLDKDNKRTPFEFRWNIKDKLFNIKLRQDALEKRPDMAVINEEYPISSGIDEDGGFVEQPVGVVNNYTGPGVWKVVLDADETLSIPCEIVLMRKDQRNARIKVQVSAIPLSTEGKQQFIDYFEQQGLTFIDSDGKKTPFNLRWNEQGKAFNIKVSQADLETSQATEPGLDILPIGG